MLQNILNNEVKQKQIERDGYFMSPLEYSTSSIMSIGISHDTGNQFKTCSNEVTKL